MKTTKYIRYDRVIVCLSFIFLIALFFINTSSFAYKEIKYKNYYISRGDTLWSIAKNEKNNNSYFKASDIRDIINNIKTINNINSNINEGQSIVIPYI